MSSLVLVRHGQSQWNLENRFTGWTDVSLTEAGRADAVLCGKSMKDIQFDAVFISRLVRAKQTFEGFLEGYGALDVPVFEDSALNERHYGDLQGLDKSETIEQYGEEQVRLWRRSYSVRPPNGESLEDCERRTWPFFRQYVQPFLTEGKNVIIFAHGNSIKPIFKNLDGMDGEQTAMTEVFCSVPYEYTFDGDKVVKKVTREVPGMVVKGTVIPAKK